MQERNNRKMNRRMSDKDIDFIRQNIYCKTISEMSRQLGFSIPSVAKRVHRMYPNFKRQRIAYRWSPDKAKEILKLWTDGFKCKDIADRYFVSETSVPSILRSVSAYYNLPYEPRFRRNNN